MWNEMSTRWNWTFSVLSSMVLFGMGALLASSPPSGSSAGSNREKKAKALTADEILLVGVGDSLTHGTIDATNNITNSAHVYLQLVADSLGQVENVLFSQPFFDFSEERIFPFRTPTNLAISGADIFSIEGVRYFKRVGAAESFLDPELLSDEILPAFLSTNYDKVMYPINLWAGRTVSQIGAANWLVRDGASLTEATRAFVVFWAGNNDSSLAALGAGGSNPQFQPIPFTQVSGELKPILSILLGLGEAIGAVSFEPYSQQSIDRNLTEIGDFVSQLTRVLFRMKTETESAGIERDWFVLTLPYYNAVGYVFDSEDLEFYLQKLDPTYAVPASFVRVAEPGEPITDPLKGDRISLLTFGLMYALLSSGHSVDFVNEVLEVDGEQNDGLVMSELEQGIIVARIDQYNAALKSVAAALGPSVHVVDVGQFLNDVLTGQIDVTVDNVTFGRKWSRGSAFGLDGVHPSYIGHAIIANFLIEGINAAKGIGAPEIDLSSVLQTDPYIDRDGDGWVPGPGYPPSGITELLFFFRDPDDNDANVQASLPVDVWDRISDVLLGELLSNAAIVAEAERRGIALPK